jgi:hypothetical protein
VNLLLLFAIYVSHVKFFANFEVFLFNYFGSLYP